MIIFAKANGTVVETTPTPFYQGSSLKGSIYLVAPFPNTNGVTIQFQLPNGNVTKAYPMTPTGEVEGVMLDGYEVSAWTWDVKNAMVTAIPGVVTATIKVIDTDDNVTSIVSSFSVIKGTPNALDPSTPSASEWQAIISALGSIGGKVTMPLMTNFEYDSLTGESKKTYNNGMVQTQTFPAINKNGFVEYQSFTRSTFSNNWAISNRTGYSKMLIISEPTIGSASGDFDIAIFKGDEDSSEKMNPLIVVDKDSSSIGIYSNEAYTGYALFFWKGSFVEQNYKEEIEKAIDDCEGATAQAENIANTLETAYENGELGIPNGGTAGQFLKKTESGTAWEDAPSGGGEYYICSPLVDGADYAPDGCFILLPLESSCSKIELIDVVYIQQPRNSTPYTTRITLNWVLYDKNGGVTTQYGYIPYQQGDTDGSGNLHDSSVYFTYSSSWGLFGGYASPETDDYESVRTSCFRFKITV